MFLIALAVYSPALHGEFVFDDLHMPFFQPEAGTWPLRLWLGVRPLLMATFWANYQLAGLDPFSYHLLNVLFHAGAAVLVFFVVRKILTLARVEPGRINTLAGFAAAVFLLHPIQTEAVSYVAQRGEDLGALFYFAALCVFLYRKPGPVSWPTAIAVLLLFGAAITTKEHTVTLPALLLLTDYFWSPGFPSGSFSFSPIKRNWRLYLPILAGAVAGALFVLQYIRKDTISVGFSLQEFTWYEYLFTQFRVFFAYIGLFFFPLWQTIDYDFPISRGILSHGAIAGLAAIALLTSAAIRYRRRFPLASYGFLVFELLLLPTTSFIPIKDVIVDRRLYLPMIGLLFVVLEALRRWNPDRKVFTAALAALCLVLGAWTYRRNKSWSSAKDLWADAAEKSPNKQRVHFGLGVAQFRTGHCKEAIESYTRGAAVEKPDYTLLMNWGLAYDCDHQPAKALELLRRSVAMKPTAQAWASIAVVEAKLGKVQEPLADLDKAESLDNRFPMTYVYRGGIHQAIGQLQEAEKDYSRALQLDPGNAAALQGLQSLGKR